MSFEGITRAGNVYQKFETMCLEMEEAMYQDTVKYLENQVQKVSVSVKKFCSEVMDDIRPLSCIDPMSVASDDMSLISYGYAGVNKKPTPGVLDNHRNLKKNENQGQVLPNITAEKGSSLSGCDVGVFSPQSPGIFIENKSPEKCKKIGVQRRAIGIKRISKINHPSKNLCHNTSVSGNRSGKVASCDTRISSRVASDNTDVTSSSDFDWRCGSGEAVKGNAPNLNHPIESPASDSSRVSCDESTVTSSSLNIVMQEPSEAVKGNTALQDNLIESPASEKVLLAESTSKVEDVSNSIPPAANNNLPDESERLKGDPESTTSSSGLPEESTGSSFRSEVSNLECDEKGVTVSNEGTSIKDCSSSVGSPSRNAQSCNEDFIMTSKDSFEIELVESDEVPELRLEKFEADNSRHDLEESCIYVEGEELHFDLQGTRKHKSYKKRIREALSSKLRSRKDVELVFSQHEQEMSDRVRGRAVSSEERMLSACDSVESDWELL